jgi:hypothetical protein
MISLAQKVADAQAKLAKSAKPAVTNESRPAPKLEAKPAAKPAAKDENAAAERKKIAITAGETALGIHHRLQRKRYGSYFLALKAYALVPVAGFLFLSGKYLFAVPFIILIGYYYSKYEEDHKRYTSWKKRPAIIPDMAIYDVKPKTVAWEGLHGLLNPPTPRTIID